MSFGIPVRNGLAIGLLASTTLSSRRGLSPALFLDFLQPYLDSRITFSRGTNATLVDSTGKITYAPANLFTFSQEFDNAAWVKGNVGVGLVPTVTANAGTAPDGTNTADRAQFSLGGGTTSGDQSILRQTIATDTSGSTLYAFSLWVRSTDGTSTYNMRMFGAPAASQAVTVTGTWTRIFVVGGGANTNYSLVLRGGQTPTNSNTADILVWGAQLEPVTYQTTPSTYNATTASAYYGPRFDYDPVTLAPRGLLIEEARTNLLLQSETFDNASWPKTDATVTANVTNAPSGTAVADKLAETATTAAHSVSQIVTIAIGTSYTYTVYAKAAERNWIALQFTGGMTANHGAYFNLANGVVGSLINSPASASITKLADGWYRCSITSAPATGTSTTAWIYTASGDGVVSYLGTAGSGVYIWGAQFEAGAFATSYIPTVASTVSRSADVATMTGTNFSTWFNASAGTFVVDSDVLSVANPNDHNLVSLFTSSTNLMRIWLWSGAPTIPRFSVLNTTTQAELASVAGVSANMAFRSAAAYSLNDFGASYNGATALTDTSGTVPTGFTQFNIGSQTGSAGFMSGHIRAIAYYNTRLPNTQLQTLTAPSLASPLALDFLSTSYTVGY
jgi:hypothetical protein